ncbi:unnamed protein product [Meganyctiphanes norvegica]|uniref:Uncharacterized protein n=1 Tax=Meganyctiphanes norvegica TaxID=48144 RepID=A0AAV2RLK3_MEGNR
MHLHIGITIRNGDVLLPYLFRNLIDRDIILWKCGRGLIRMYFLIKVPIQYGATLLLNFFENLIYCGYDLSFEHQVFCEELVNEFNSWRRLYVFTHTSVNHHMQFKITITQESFVTLAALIWFLLGVTFFHMLYKIFICNIIPITLAAFIRSLSSVNFYMVIKIDFS